jgi:hypothetical protein
MVGLVRDAAFELDADPGVTYTHSLSDFPSWQEPPELLVEQFSTPDRKFGACDWYRLVDGLLGVDSEDFRLKQRFRALYAELLSPCPPPREATQVLSCRIQVRDGLPVHLVSFVAPSEIAIVDFILALFPGRGYVEIESRAAGWRSIGLAGKTSPLLTARGSEVLVDAHEEWRPLVANCAVNWVMQMQPGVLFFHAAAVAIRGEGVLIVGEKGAGKSTLSLALASHGHDFFGDEIAAVRTEGFELAPFRRALSVRKGPQAPQVEEKLRSKCVATETFPDGTVRSRATANELFPEVGARPRPLRRVFFLRGFEEQPRYESFRPRSEDLRLLAPLASTYWGSSSAARVTQVAKLLSSVECYFLYPGQPEDTTNLIERIVRSE